MLSGKRALVVGVANARSIAWSIADQWRREGADVFITYQNERFRGQVEKLVRDNWGTPGGGSLSVPATACDVSKEDEVEALWRGLHEKGFCCPRQDRRREPEGLPDRRCDVVAHGGVAGSGEGFHDGVHEEKGGSHGGIDAVLHSVAYAPPEAMQAGSFLKGTTLDSFVTSHVISAYSLVSIVRHGLPYLAPGASIVSLSYLGSERAARNYGVMGPAKASLESCSRALAQELGPSAHGGIRVNCLSAGPVRTMAARGIMGFDEMRREAAARSPLGRDVELREIAGAATFLASPMASGITGQTLHVDCGFSAVI